MRELILVGTIVRPHGVEGKLRMLSACAFETLRRLRKVCLMDPAGNSQWVRLRRTSPLGRRGAILEVEGVESLEEARSLVGRSVWMRRADLPPLREGEYYWADLVGLQVVTQTGRRLGQISSVMPTKAHDVFVVREDGREHLIPATEEVVKRVDLAAGVMVIEPLPGLLEDEG